MVVREETHIPEQGARINPRNMRARINSGENWYQFRTHVSMVDEDQPWKRSAVGCCNWMIIYLCWLRTVGTRGWWWYESKRGGVTAPPCCRLISLAPPHCQAAASTPTLGYNACLTSSPREKLGITHNNSHDFHLNCVGAHHPRHFLLCPIFDRKAGIHYITIDCIDERYVSMC
jgi:hypothetical protein